MGLVDAGVVRNVLVGHVLVNSVDRQERLIICLIFLVACWQ